MPYPFPNIPKIKNDDIYIKGLGIIYFVESSEPIITNDNGSVKNQNLYRLQTFLRPLMSSTRHHKRK